MFEQVWGGAVLLVGGVKYERLRAVAGLVGYGESEVKRALMATAYTGNIEAVKQHLVASMDVNVKDTGFFRMTPLDYAFFRSQDDRLLKSRVAVGNAVSHGAIIDHVEITIKECGGNDTFQNLGQQIPSHRRLCGWRRVEAPSKKSYHQQRKRYVSCGMLLFMIPFLSADQTPLVHDQGTTTRKNPVAPSTGRVSGLKTSTPTSSQTGALRLAVFCTV